MARQASNATQTPSDPTQAAASESGAAGEIADSVASAPESKMSRSRDVTFRMPAGETESAMLVGDFNGWSTDATPMERSGDSFEVTIPLEPGEHRYRYLLDGARWENDWQADDYVPNEFGSDDSVRRV